MEHPATEAGGIQIRVVDQMLGNESGLIAAVSITSFRQLTGSVIGMALHTMLKTCLSKTSDWPLRVSKA